MSIRVLVAEDDRVTCELIKQMLTMSGHEMVGEAASGLEAVEMIRALQPDVVLMDLQMPEMDGVEAIKKIQETSPTPVVILSAYETKELIKRASEAGAAAYLTKPTEPKELDRAISIAMARHADMMELQRLNREQDIEKQKLKKEVTERKRVEAALRKSETQLKEAQRIAHIGSWEWDIANNTIQWSEELYRIYKNQVGKTISFQFWRDSIHDKDRKRVVNEVHKSLADKRPLNTEFKIICVDGEIRHIQAAADVFCDSEGNPVRMLGTAQDITERKLQDMERQRLETKLQNAQKLESLGVLAGGVAHDFNNLLMGVIGHADMALSRISPVSPAHEDIEHILTAAERAAELSAQMLAYSGKGKLKVKPIDLSCLVEEMAHILAATIASKTKLELNLDNDLPLISGDATQLRQVVMNIISNAAEAIGSERGHITISTGSLNCDQGFLNRTYVNDDLGEGTYVFLKVKDTGIGMDEDTRTKMFDPFFTTKLTGRGLGLAALLGILRGHQGAINVNSELGQGTTATVVIPAAISTESETSDSTEHFKWKGKGTILLVDDDESVRIAAGEMVHALGFTILTANDGRDAIEVYRQHSDDIILVILDLRMPLLDGEGAFDELRKISPEVKIILSSGHIGEEITERFSDKNLSGFIQKPYRLSKLREIISQALKKP